MLDLIVSLMKEFTNHVASIFQNLPKFGLIIVGMFKLNELDNEGNIERHSPDIAATDRNKFVVFIFLRGKIRTTPHRAGNRPGFLKELRNRPVFRRQ